MVTVFDMAAAPEDQGQQEQVFPRAPREDRQPDVWDLLKKPTGKGQIEDYLDHPLNVSRSAGLGQAIRGLSGLLGSLDYAVVDIVLGVFRALMEGRKNATG